MKQTQDRIHQLMTEKRAGILDAARESYLDNLIETDAEVREKWETIKKILPSENSIYSSYSLDNTPWASTESKPVQIRSLSWIRWAAACIVVIIVSGTGYYFWSLNSAETPLVVALADKSESLTLTLADGQKINLVEKTGQIETQDLSLQNKNKTLTFSDVLPNKSKSKGQEFNTLTVPIGMDYKIELADGSMVWLNSATKIRFPFQFDAEKREIFMDGEAYFQVKEDKNRPFIVHLPQSDVRVLGTEFNVNTYTPEVDKVALLEGSVQVNAQDEQVTIQPGTELTYSPQTGTTQRPFDAKQVLAWQKGLYYFYNASLAEICQILPRWFGLDIVWDNPAIQTKRFAGLLNRNDNIEVFLEDLKTITKIEYYIDNENKVLHFKLPEDK